ncbi:MAG: hypothetical protein A2286_02530 [Gammaproteobacteria bacterium RIFOXYA12_FULL_61_12]|nr:MAG: hypothetical protein A2514_10335 [Gammaproteobacteria bacterium RIFOXYD12_FULL_61_37]OGT92928.1 MAG: hypothetical protein A2286_02530 [Gammaproteobacteria bacterium RIFOXYA12_FULL_61_12]
MDKIESRSPQPQDYVCHTCAKWREDCGELQFENMPIAKVASGGAVVVQCAEYVARTPLARAQFESEMSANSDRILSEAEKAIAGMYPGAFNPER